MIAEDEAAIHFLELGDGVGFGDIPVGVGIILTEFARGGPGMEAEEPAGATFDDAEGFGGGAVETVSGFKEDADGAAVAGGARIAFFDAVGMGNGFGGGDVSNRLEGQIACSFSSRREIWWRLRSVMSCEEVNLRMGRSEERFRIILGSRGSAAQSALSSVQAIWSLPRQPGIRPISPRFRVAAIAPATSLAR